MTVKRGGLGRNLSALLGANDSKQATQTKVKTWATLPLTSLQPGRYQPRDGIDESTLDELAASIKKQGVLQPLLVRTIGPDKYEIIAGERRWRASRLAGMETVPAVVHDVDDEMAMAMALVENLQRENLNAMDQARAMHRLTTEFDLTHKNIAELLSVSRTAVTNSLRLLNLHADVKLMLERGELDMGHARCLLMLDEKQQHEVAQLVFKKQLSVRETEVLVVRIKSGIPEKSDRIQDVQLFEEEINTLQQQLETKIMLKPTKVGRGSLVFRYNSQEKLQRILTMLMQET